MSVICLLITWYVQDQQDEEDDDDEQKCSCDVFDMICEKDVMYSAFKILYDNDSIEQASFFYALAYLRRLCENSQTRLVMTKRNVFVAYFTALCLSEKMLSDDNTNTKVYDDIFGFVQGSFKGFETNMLFLLNWEMTVSDDELYKSAGLLLHILNVIKQQE